MAMTINTNVVSINAQRNLSLSGSQLGTAMQRLSSGLRVNSAKDDAAGLAIAERMNAQSRGLAVAARNANDGISLAQTAEGAMGKVGDMLQRMRELAVQASNATNSEADRKALQAEVGQLIQEIDRVAKTSQFNGKNLLDGSFAGGVFQVGAGAGDNITVGALADARSDSLGKTAYATTTAKSVAMDKTGFNKETAANVVLTAKGQAFDFGKLEAAASMQERLGDLASKINATTADSGVTAFVVEKDGAYTIQLMSDDVEADADGKMVLANDIKVAGLVEDESGLADAALDVAADSDAVVPAKGLTDLKVDSQANAWVALKQIDDAINKINSSRADLGALQTRFEKSIENIDIMNENISAARGRIVDADFAAETASLSRTQILQQAGTAMVAQANQLPQQVLSLLR